MTSVETLISRLEEGGRRLEKRNGRLWVPVNVETLPAGLLQELIERKPEILVALDKRQKTERHQWVMTPHGPAKVWDFLDEERIGVILKSELEAAAGPCRVHFIAREDVRPVKSFDELVKTPERRIEDPSSSRETGAEEWEARHLRLPHYKDGVVQEGVCDKWMVLERLDRPGAVKTWFVGTEKAI